MSGIEELFRSVSEVLADEVQRSTKRKSSPSGREVEANIYENEDEYILVVEVPGVKKGDVIVEVSDGRINVGYNKCNPFEDYGYCDSCNKNKFGWFDYSVDIPNYVDQNSIRSGMKDGLLVIRGDKITYEVEIQDDVDLPVPESKKVEEPKKETLEEVVKPMEPLLDMFGPDVKGFYEKYKDADLNNPEDITRIVTDAFTTLISETNEKTKEIEKQFEESREKRLEESKKQLEESEKQREEIESLIEKSKELNKKMETRDMFGMSNIFSTISKKPNPPTPPPRSPVKSEIPSPPLSPVLKKRKQVNYSSDEGFGKIDES